MCAVEVDYSKTSTTLPEWPRRPRLMTELSIKWNYNFLYHRFGQSLGKSHWKTLCCITHNTTGCRQWPHMASRLWRTEALLCLMSNPAPVVDSEDGFALLPPLAADVLLCHHAIKGSFALHLPEKMRKICWTVNRPLKPNDLVLNWIIFVLDWSDWRQRINQSLLNVLHVFHSLLWMIPSLVLSFLNLPVLWSSVAGTIFGAVCWWPCLCFYRSHYSLCRVVSLVSSFLPLLILNTHFLFF